MLAEPSAAGSAVPGRHCAAGKALAECRSSSLSLQEVCGLYLALLLGGHWGKLEYFLRVIVLLPVTSNSQAKGRAFLSSLEGRAALLTALVERSHEP